MDDTLETTRNNKKSSRFRQGYFTPTNPDKYVGDVTKIRYMSSWELQTNEFLDGNPHILKWASEEIAIPYIKPTDGKVHKYYVDYWIQYRSKSGEIITELVEVKPKSQTQPPRKNHKHYLYEQLQYAVNIEKWKAAAAFAEKRGWRFRVITEKSIFS